mmetsp:Transcript_435/g.962  ORF Transcript_435/g.962 Transcript_435/m.962 type:complete len:98 (+) Transcript_435:126-419(+)
MPLFIDRRRLRADAYDSNGRANYLSTLHACWNYAGLRREWRENNPPQSLLSHAILLYCATFVAAVVFTQRNSEDKSRHIVASGDGSNGFSVGSSSVD